MARRDGTVAIEDKVRKCLRVALKGSPYRRDDVAKRMSVILDREVTKSMLADFCRNATQKRHVRFPAAWVPAFCEATEDFSLVLAILPQEVNRTLQLGDFLVEARLRFKKTNEQIVESLRSS